MNFVYCQYEKYLYFVEYLASISRIIKFEIKFYRENEVIYINNFDCNYIFLQELPKNIKIENNNLIDFNQYKIYVINTEQLSYNIHSTNMNSYSKIVKIIDYNISNIKYYNREKYKNIYYLPYQINEKEIFNFPKINNICMIDSKSKYRLNILNKLNSLGYQVNIIRGFGGQRDELLFRHKILINISHNPQYNILETMRCDRCIYNKMIVISDYKEDMEKYYLKENIIFVPYNEMVKKVIEVIHNYNYYYDMLFKNFNYEELDKKIKELSKDTVLQLNNS